MNKLGYSVTELIDVWPFGRTTTYQLLNSGQLRAKKYGEKTIVTSEDAKACLDSLPDYPVKDKSA